MIVINSEVTIPDGELKFIFSRSSGPGGQNVNKVASAVQLRFDIENSQSLRKEVKQRLKLIAGRRVTRSGTLLIEADNFRSQGKNRQDAIDRLALLIRRALIVPRARKKTKPSRASRNKRLESKRRHSIKKSRRRESFD